MHIYSDFDGTIACADVTDLVLEKFAPVEWQAIEADWQQGRIDAATCMRRQIRLIEASPAALDALLDTVEIDPGFSDFAAWCAANDLPLTIVSDGVDHFIRSVLTRHGLERIPVFANRLVREGSRYRLEQPWRSGACAAKSGVCKCDVVRSDRSPSVYIGDGRSDECASATADILFAKDKLAAFCSQNRIEFTPFETFHDVRQALAGFVQSMQRRQFQAATHPRNPVPSE